MISNKYIMTTIDFHSYHKDGVVQRKLKNIFDPENIYNKKHFRDEGNDDRGSWCQLCNSHPPVTYRAHPKFNTDFREKWTNTWHFCEKCISNNVEAFVLVWSENEIYFAPKPQYEEIVKKKYRNCLQRGYSAMDRAVKKMGINYWG
jgi:hypothetical protein